MKFVDALPKNNRGKIILPVAGSNDGQPVEGEVAPEWLATNYPDIANAEVPLSAEPFAALQGIDEFWSESAALWREQGFI